MKAGEEGGLHGLVLSGGESRRMGRDKGLIADGEGSWVNRAGVLLREAGLAVSVMIREQQRPAYEEVVLPALELLSDRNIPVQGPLRGLLSFQKYRPGRDVLAVPCDMPNLSGELLRELVRLYAQNPGAQAWVFENRARVQPFPGIYSAGLLAGAADRAERGTLPGFGLVRLLTSANAFRHRVEQDAAFRNLNRSSDFPS